MSDILVAGLVNIETTLRVEHFPLEYCPITYPFFGIGSAVSGVAMNVAAALSALGDRARVTSMTGEDDGAALVRSRFAQSGWSLRWLYPGLRETPQSVVIYDADGRRQCHCDLKDMQEQSCPAGDADELLDGVLAAVVCNTNYARPLLSAARERGVPVVTDVHVLADPEDEYNADFIGAADYLFLSDEGLPEPPESFVLRLAERSPARAIVIGLGAKGALLWLRETGGSERLPAIYTRPVVNTVGAGDALLSGFTHYIVHGLGEREALRRATVFASYKTGESGASRGFADEPTLERYL